jgi:hypothetical protein
MKKGLSKVNMTKLITATLSFIVWFAGVQTTPNASAQAPVSSTSSAVVLPGLQLRGSTQTMFATLVKEAGLSGGRWLEPGMLPSPGKSCVHSSGH